MENFITPYGQLHTHTVRRNSERLVVFFSSVYIGKNHPYYPRISWANSLTEDCIFISDPLQYPEGQDTCGLSEHFKDELTPEKIKAYQVAGGSWFINPNGQSMVGDYVDSLRALITEKKYKKIIFYGSSMGGYLALLFARYFKDVHVIAECPQIKLLDFQPSADLLAALSPSPKKLPLPAIDATFLRSNRNSFHLIVHLLDGHIETQIHPLIKRYQQYRKAGKECQKIDISYYGNAKYVKEHAALRMEDAIPIIQCA